MADEHGQKNVAVEAALGRSLELPVWPEGNGVCPKRNDAWADCHVAEAIQEGVFRCTRCGFIGRLATLTVRDFCGDEGLALRELGTKIMDAITPEKTALDYGDVDGVRHYRVLSLGTLSDGVMTSRVLSFAPSLAEAIVDAFLAVAEVSKVET